MDNESRNENNHKFSLGSQLKSFGIESHNFREETVIILHFFCINLVTSDCSLTCGGLQQQCAGSSVAQHCRNGGNSTAQAYYHLHCAMPRDLVSHKTRLPMSNETVK